MGNVFIFLVHVIDMDDALDDLHKDNIDDMQNDFEKTVEVVEWSCVVEQENDNGKNVSPAKTPQKDKSIFDSVFPNSFISANGPRDSSNERKVAELTLTTINTKPKTDILGKSKNKDKRFVSGDEISNTTFEPIYNRKYIVDLSPIKRHPPKNNLKEKLVCGSECHIDNEVLKEKSEFLKEINSSIEEEANSNPVSIYFRCYG